MLPEADAVKAKGSPQSKLAKSYGMKNSRVVCGDQLCPQIGSSADQQSRFQVGGVMQQNYYQEAQIKKPNLLWEKIKPAFCKVPTALIFDPDNDKLTTGIENQLGTNPNRADTDGDGISDYDEVCKFPTSDPTKDDTDNDGILDKVDQCKRNSETVNAYQDTDGCPDTLPDSDNDTIPDSLDQCPTQAETVNAYQDTDGCPDTAPPDTTKPTVTITSSPPFASETANPEPYTITITFSEPVTGLTISDFSSYGLTIGSLSGSGTTYTMDVTLGMGSNSISLPLNRVADAAGNGNNGSNTLNTSLYAIITIPSISGTKYYDQNMNHDISDESPLQPMDQIEIRAIEYYTGQVLVSDLTDTNGYYELQNVQVRSDRPTIICENIPYALGQGLSYPWSGPTQRPTGTVLGGCGGWPISAMLGYLIDYSYTGPTTGLDFGNNSTVTP